MGGMMRESSFLPTIKCSMCAQEIDISMMGEHVCSSIPAEPSPPMESSRGFEENLSFRRKPSGPNLFKSRAMPPRVDISAANRPFFRQDQLTPVSASSDSRSLSPRTPNDGQSSPFGRPQQKPMASSLPSPGISSNLDSSYPRFPPRQASTNPYRMNEGDAMYAPVSPRPENGGLLKRMDSIAPGPFDPNSRRPSKTHLEPRPQTSHSQRSDGPLRSHPPDPSMRSPMSSTFPEDIDNRAPTIPNLDWSGSGGYGGLTKPAPKDEEPRPRLENRSNTFPKPDEAKNDLSLQRSPSEPDKRFRRPLINDASENKPINKFSPPRQRRPSNAGPDLTRVPPPRGMSFLGAKTPNGEMPPLPTKLDLAAEFGISNPYHTPSMSQSSNDSGRSAVGTASSQSSPPSARSIGRRKAPDQADTSRFDDLMKDLEKSMVPPAVPTAASASRGLPTAPRPQPSNKPATKTLAPSMLCIESPIISSFPASVHLHPHPHVHSNLSNSSSSLSTTPPPSQPSTTRPLPPKHTCKSCALPIARGTKSLSSADGRLTGRYHPACFVCTTCFEPFATTSFYVLHDKPYCERHYHKLNGSCCVGCDKGIEGVYLETERAQKFHAGCLKCSDCRGRLGEEYYEVEGNVYCERDAWRRANGGGKNNVNGRLGVGGGLGGRERMERRTTRLMVM